MMRFPVAELSAGGAFLCSVRPPDVGVELMMSLQVGAEAHIDALKAEVVAARIDPAAAERSGFEVRFTKVESVQLERLLDLLESLGRSPRKARVSQAPGGHERRGQPRVDVDFRADVALPSGIETIRMENLSLSGALLVAGDKLPKGLRAGYQTELLVYAPTVPEALAIECKVVRLISGGGKERFAVRFIEMDDDTAATLESLILYAMIQHGFPTLPS